MNRIGQAGAETTDGTAPVQGADGPVAASILRGVVRLLIARGEIPIDEFSLPNGRRADVAALSRDGRITIVEIKSCLADYRADQKWPEYRDYCDALYFAVRPDFPRDVLPEECGLILADRYGGDIVRPAPVQPALAAARRKALTLRFARVAAYRLAGVSDDAIFSGTGTVEF